MALTERQCSLGSSKAVMGIKVREPEETGQRRWSMIMNVPFSFHHQLLAIPMLSFNERGLVASLPMPLPSLRGRVINHVGLGAPGRFGQLHVQLRLRS